MSMFKRKEYARHLAFGFLSESVHDSKVEEDQRWKELDAWNHKKTTLEGSYCYQTDEPHFACPFSCLYITSGPFYPFHEGAMQQGPSSASPTCDKCSKIG
jgi:hypothetical protein